MAHARLISTKESKSWIQILVNRILGLKTPIKIFWILKVYIHTHAGICLYVWIYSLIHELKSAKTSYVSYLNFLAARQESHRLREQVDSTITESANSMWRSWNESNDALRTRIAESTEAHTRLQYHLSRTKQEIYDQEKHIWALKRAIRDKEAPLKVIYERLY